jgi:transcriptional regulator GlxA family with amidase domain
MTLRRHVAILLFDDVEVLDFAGPFEVFAVTGQREGEGLFRVYTVSAAGQPVRARNGLRIIPDFGFADCPSPEILLVPGGQGTRQAMHDAALTDWVRAQAGHAELTLSVCTGALILGRAGLLEGLTATTHHGALELLRRAAPGARVRDELRIADNGRIVLSGGISAGIDMSLHVVARLLGRAQAEETARHMEYRWQPEPGFRYSAQAAG